MCTDIAMTDKAGYQICPNCAHRLLCDWSKLTMKDNFQDHLSNQESILQSTRELHYVLQALFLGIRIYRVRSFILTFPLFSDIVAA